MEKPLFTGRLAVVLTAALVAAPVLYLAAYLGLQVEQAHPTGDFIFRFYSADWQCSMFGPAAKVEKLVTGTHVLTFFRDGGDEMNPSYTVHDADNQPESSPLMR